MAKRRAWMLAVAGVTALAGALAIWVVPAFSGGAANKWTWVSGRVVSDSQSDSSLLSVYNASTDAQSVTVRAVRPTGAAVAPTSPATVTIAAGHGSEWSWDCSDIGGCEYIYTVETQSPDLVPSIAFIEEGAGSPDFTGLLPPGGFQVFGPNQLSTAATTQNISNASAFIQAEVQDLQGKTSDLQDKTGALQSDTTKLKEDTAALQIGNAALQGDTAQLRKSAKKTQKQLKKVLKAVR